MAYPGYEWQKLVEAVLNNYGTKLTVPDSNGHAFRVEIKGHDLAWIGAQADDDSARRACMWLEAQWLTIRLKAEGGQP